VLYRLADEEEHRGSGLYSITSISSGSRVRVKYVIRENEKNFITKEEGTCQDICGFGKQEADRNKIPWKDDEEISKEISLVSQGKTTTLVNKPAESTEGNKNLQTAYSSVNELTKVRKTAVCTTTGQCRAWNKAQSINIGGTPYDITSAKPGGFAQGCFYDDNVGQ